MLGKSLLWKPAYVVLGALLAGGILLTRLGFPSSSADEAAPVSFRSNVETILRYQQAYLNEIHSADLRVTCTRTLGAQSQAVRRQLREANAKIEPGAELTPVGNRVIEQGHFVFSGSWYWSEQEVVSPNGNQEVGIYAWDGKHYQMLTGGQNRALAVGESPPEVQEADWNPLTEQYLFFPGLGMGGQSRDALKQWNPWRELLSMAVDCNKTTWKGHPGFLVTFTNKEGITAEVFFAADQEYHPWHWKVSNPAHVPGVNEMEYEVVRGYAPIESNRLIVIPLVSRLTVDNGDQYLYEIDAATLKINVPMDQSRFAIPDSVEYIHADLDTHQSLPSAAASGEDAMIARLLVGHVYDGSMAGWNYFQRVADAIVREQWNDAVVGRAGRYLQARFGAVQKLELLSSDLGATTVDTVWRVAASQGVFSMQTEFDVSGKLTGVWFQLDPDGQWTALADLGSEAP